ncbi:MAG: bifunctional (p)ppGpp synthetase/guanosine-3',5'-bis(diphosphate) 3'-pyrophosphohydrolase [Burkholderiaceae bacterium]|jgi:GTP pyrophosphokinase|nr:bifunctional (p)ppGpp synthetase/guanosine-3',5'-bis(diphosphate) 3'-pyrophosphohydrolase [Burkholderiaceae bacterium]
MSVAVPLPPEIVRVPEAPPAALNAAAASFTALTVRLDYLSDADVEQVRRAYCFADQAHLGQLRNSGEPYITHPIAVAAQCTEWRLDAPALMAALLHDVIEDCGVTKANLIERFGAQVADLVDGVTKLDKLQFNTREENQAESFRKMLLAMARDVRVILVKLADRTHNMRTLVSASPEKWGRIAHETLDIYAPIAHRLGLNQTYRELQDLSFRYMQPWRYTTLAKAVSKARSRGRDLIQKVQRDIETAFAGASMSIRMAGREKTLYSIYRKMKDKQLSFAQLTDIYGFRLVLPTTIDCYTALGILHRLYKPIPGRFKDHIAIPKANGYQSLHTTVVGPSSMNIEFQLRTETMHHVAEAGVATHWLYKSADNGAAPSSASSERFGAQWLQSLLDIEDETRDATEFWDHIKVDLFPDAVYVFTPKGRILALPRGATVVDFAYAIHSDIGDRTSAARINGEQVPLRTELRNGDVVEVITASVARPNPAWLDFVRTGRARSKIRHHIKAVGQAAAEKLGERMLGQALRAEGLGVLPAGDAEHQPVWDKLLRFTGNRSRAELLADIGMGKRIAAIVAKRLVVLLAEHGEKPDALVLSRERLIACGSDAQSALIIDGSETAASVRFALCCRPVPGDSIVGYLGHGEGLIVHACACSVGQRLRDKEGAERFFAVEWGEEPTRSFETGVLIKIQHDKGALARVAQALSSAEADINRVGMPDGTQQDSIDLHFIIAVRDVDHLEAVLRAVRHTPSVLAATRAESVA